MNTTPNGNRMSKNERQAERREQARQLREAARKKERRNRFLLQGGIIVAVIAVAAIIALVIITSVKPAGPGPRNMGSDGVLINAGGEVQRSPGLEPGGTPAPNPTPSADIIEIQTYVDFFCPHCGAFEATNGDYLRTLVESGAASLEIFPVAFLDRASMGTEYSTRSMNAFACVADGAPASVFDFQGQLFANQPPEPSTGLDNATLIQLASESGATSEDIAACINEQRFAGWAGDATQRAQERGVTGTPSVFVNGQLYPGSLTDQATFRQFVASAESVQFVETQSTPSPTPAG